MACLQPLSGMTPSLPIVGLFLLVAAFLVQVDSIAYKRFEADLLTLD